VGSQTDRNEKIRLCRQVWAYVALFKIIFRLENVKLLEMSAVIVAIRLRSGRSGFRVPVGARLFSETSRLALGSTNLLI